MLKTVKFKAFTMAEAILVMTVLGIIATIMITTIRPSEFQEKGLKILAQKVLSEIDTATQQVLFNDSADSTFDHLYEDGTTTQFTVSGYSDDNTNSELLADLYKKYLITIRRAPTSKMPFITAGVPLVLKNGAEMGIWFKGGSVFPTIFPGETNSVNVRCDYGFIVFDINGGDGPNVMGKDQFWIPYDKYGIKYD